MNSDALRLANLAFSTARPGETAGRQPVHTLISGAQFFHSDVAARLGAAAQSAMDQWAPDPASMAEALRWPVDGALSSRIHALVRARLAAQPVEDFRVDFEDGYGNRPDSEEDAQALAVGAALARGMAESTLPAFIGLRVKPLNEELRGRSERTLALLLEALLGASGGRLPENFVVTLPKITVVAQVEHFVRSLEALEHRFALAPRALRFEVMVETPQSIIDADGRCPLPAMIAAGGGRIKAALLGTYDYTASLGITADHQHMRHPACDFAKHVMQVALAGTGIWLSDGSTAVLPVTPPRDGNRPPTDAERADDRQRVHRAWRRHYDDVTHSLVGGFYQGWDLHPAQLVTRYAALFHFFLSGMTPAAHRLRNFVEKAAQATLVGDVFDDAATGQALLNYFLRAINCGAASEEEVIAQTGLSMDELRGRSFPAVLRGRTGR